MRAQDPNREAQAALNRREHAQRRIRALRVKIAINAALAAFFVAAAGLTIYQKMNEETEMAEHDRQLMIRVPEEIIDRADALIPSMEKEQSERMLPARVSRSAVMRVALQKGLEQLEAEYEAESDAE